MQQIKRIMHGITTDSILFFDMDGTLIDTDLSNFLSYKKAINSVTKSNDNLIYNPKVRFNRSILKKTIPNLTESDYERIIQKKEYYYKDFIHETKLNKEITAILFKYSKSHKTVLVTNSREDRAITTLKHFGLINQFSNIICREFNSNDIKINKFQNAITKLGICPNRVIVFENE